MANYKISGYISENAVIRIYKQATNQYLAYKVVAGPAPYEIVFEMDSFENVMVVAERTSGAGGALTYNYVVPVSTTDSVNAQDPNYLFATIEDLTTISGIAQEGKTHAESPHAPSDANNYVHPTTAGNKHVPAAGSAGQILEYNAAGEAKWGRKITVSTSDPSGGADGDLWLKI